MFCLSLSQDVYQWCGSECNRFERLKASQVAIDIRDNERNGRAKLHMVEEGSEPSAVIEVTHAHIPLFPNELHQNLSLMHDLSLELMLVGVGTGGEKDALCLCASSVPWWHCKQFISMEGA